MAEEHTANTNMNDFNALALSSGDSFLVQYVQCASIPHL